MSRENVTYVTKKTFTATTDGKNKFQLIFSFVLSKIAKSDELSLCFARA